VAGADLPAVDRRVVDVGGDPGGQQLHRAAAADRPRHPHRRPAAHGGEQAQVTGHPAQQPACQRHPADRDLDPVGEADARHPGRPGEAAGEQPEREGGAEGDHVGGDLAGQRHRPAQHAGDGQHRATGVADDPEPLLGVELGRARPRRRVHHHLLGRQAADQVVAVLLDAAGPRREVVGHQQQLHGARF
jgi:hypothetical protein